ncbi:MULTISPECIES: hypothetical protein [Lysinibacillus]|uniref:hypothetical protein n=1 Tax=Lysinibacillus TaxID=400634 RepID=UPI00214C3CD9|nr:MULTISPECIES: hypothetical protein [Lysinibacillus]UUV25921.1 hypothetical protein NP781_04695 [Lysinibacillus sp. FN11]UYB48794.1 hypothetical protein OCI51_07485 [Lysinibacillus capsici]
MINPFYKHEHVAKIVDTEEYGIIILGDLPIEGRRNGRWYEVNWSRVGAQTESESFILAITKAFDLNSRPLTVIRIIE